MKDLEASSNKTQSFFMEVDFVRPMQIPGAFNVVLHEKTTPIQASTEGRIAGSFTIFTKEKICVESRFGYE